MVFPGGPAGVVIARGLARLGLPAALAAALLLYLIGLGGGQLLRPDRPAARPGRPLWRAVPPVLLYPERAVPGPLFLLLGAAGVRLGRGISALGTLLSLAGMSLEAFWPAPRAGPATTACIFSSPDHALPVLLLLNGGRGQDRTARRLSLLIYLLHP